MLYRTGWQKGAVLERDDFNAMMNEYYEKRKWDQETSKPVREKLKELNLS